MVLKKKRIINHEYYVCMVYTIICSAIVVRVDLSQTTYEVTEDAGSVEICAMLSGPGIERNLMILLVISEGTAQGMQWFKLHT